MKKQLYKDADGIVLSQMQTSQPTGPVPLSQIQSLYIRLILSPVAH